jgi:hypothetical protein
MSKQADEIPWWGRYAIGIGLIWYVIHTAYDPDTSRGLIICLIVIAACVMYEILLGLIFIGIAWAIGGAIAGIPTSVAVIIAALIIADSNKK